MDLLSVTIGRMVILVRHAMPQVDPAVDPSLWVLGEEGIAGAKRLRFPDGARLVASGEPKAIQTLAPSGAVTSDARFNEISRVEPFGDNFRELRRSYVEGADHPDWEPRAEVVARFDDGIASYAERPLVIASHGMAMTVWLTAQLGLPDPGGFWSSLRFPDALAVDLTARTVSRLPHAAGEAV